MYKTHSYGERLFQPKLMDLSVVELLLDFESLRWEPDTLFKIVYAGVESGGVKEPRVVAYQFFQDCYGWKTSVHTLQGKNVIDFMPALISLKSKRECFKEDGLRGYFLGAEKKVVSPRPTMLDYESWCPGNRDIMTAHERFHFTGTVDDLIKGLRGGSFDVVAYHRKEAEERRKKIGEMRNKIHFK